MKKFLRLTDVKLESGQRPLTKTYFFRNGSTASHNAGKLQ